MIIEHELQQLRNRRAPHDTTASSFKHHSRSSKLRGINRQCANTDARSIRSRNEKRTKGNEKYMTTRVLIDALHLQPSDTNNTSDFKKMFPLLSFKQRCGLGGDFASLRVSRWANNRACMMGTDDKRTQEESTRTLIFVKSEQSSTGPGRV